MCNCNTKLQNGSSCPDCNVLDCDTVYCGSRATFQRIILSPLSGLKEYIPVNNEMISVRLQGRWPVRTSGGGRGYTAQLWPIEMVNRTQETREDTPIQSQRITSIEKNGPYQEPQYCQGREKKRDTEKMSILFSGLQQIASGKKKPHL